MKSSPIARPLLAITLLLSTVGAASPGRSTFQQAVDLAQKGRKAEALELFRRITSDDSTNLEAWNNRAGLEAALGNLDEARSSLEHALAVRPDLAVLSRNLEKVRSRQAHLAYDSAFGTSSPLSPLALEMRQNVSSQPDPGLRKEVDSLQVALDSARIEARRSGQWRDSLLARDREIALLRANQTTRGTAVVAAVESSSKTDASPVRTTEPARPIEPPNPGALRPSGKTSSSVSPLEALTAWAKAWTDRDVEAYFAAYVPEYHPPGMSHGEWVEKRRERIRAPKWIKVEVHDPKTVHATGNRVEVVYRQVYQTEGSRLTSRKRIELTLVEGKWKIEEEKEAR
jgi:tetratricopeptide (TPR) repeat protein